MREPSFSSDRSKTSQGGVRIALILFAWAATFCGGFALFTLSGPQAWRPFGQSWEEEPSLRPSVGEHRGPLVTRSKVLALAYGVISPTCPNPGVADQTPGQGQGVGGQACNTDSLPISPEVLLRLEEQLQNWARLDRSPVEVALLEDCEDGQLHRFPFFTAVLIAGGTSETAIPKYEAVLARHIAKVRELTKDTTEEMAILRLIFRYLHGAILTGSYQVAATNPAEALDTGRFNCVSATILFKLLAESAGFRADIRQLPTHAFCWIETPTASIPVECTAPRWLEDLDWSNPGRFLARREGSTGPEDPLRFGDARRPISTARPAPTDWSAYEHGRIMSEVEVLGTIYYNRGVDYLFEKRFPQALAANLVAVRLDPTNRSARDNLLASLNNWAIALAEAQNFPEAASRLHWALRCAPSAQPVQANLVRLYRQWRTALIKQGRGAEFNAYLQEALATLEAIPGSQAVRNGLLQLQALR